MRLFSDFWKVLREFNPEEISREAQQPIKLVVISSPETDKTSLVRSLVAGAPLALHPSLVQSLNLPADPNQVQPPVGDVVIHILNATVGFTPADRRLAVLLYGQSRPVLYVFQTSASSTPAHPSVPSAAAARALVAELFGHHAPQAVLYLDHSFRAAHDFANSRELGDREDIAHESAEHQALLRTILDLVPQKQLALGRSLPAARPHVANSAILQTSIANAQFALLSSLPANLPIVGGVIGSSADFVVLTKNQALLVYRLAALYGRDHTAKMRLLAEMAPVVGAGFLWRTLARTIVGFLPTAMAAVPKTAVAFVGTYVIGRCAQFYYATGRRPSQAALRAYSAEGTDLWAELFRPAAGDDSER